MRNGEGEAVNGSGGHNFYGSVSVSERGQIVIPAQARHDHGILGDKLIVLGGQDGIAFIVMAKLMGI